MMMRMGKSANFLLENLLDQEKVTKESCMDEDCFHPCYNTEYTMHCPVCLNEVTKSLMNKIPLE